MTYMSLFWNEIVEAGYYDKVFKNGNVKKFIKILIFLIN